MPPAQVKRRQAQCRQQKSVTGLTLIEIMVCIAIMSILSFIVAPSLSQLYQNSRSDRQINQLSQLIRYTRSEALSRRTRVTLCPSSSGLVCEQDWSHGAMIYIDSNNDSERNPDEPLLRLVRPLIPAGALSYNNPSNKVVFSRQGFPQNSAGSFIYCPENGDVRFARTLIMNFQGRLRVGQDSNHDGIIETSQARNVQCR